MDPGRSSPDPCEGALPISAFEAQLGALLTPAGGCAMVVETRPSPSLFSWGGAKVRDDVAPWFTLTLRWRRLGERGGAPLELAFPGATLLVTDHKVAWWENDGRWAEEGWHDLEVDTGRVHSVRLEQAGVSVRAFIDEVPVPPFELSALPPAGPLSVALKGGPGDRARVWVDAVHLRRHASGTTPSASSR
jgi:hypothetical protein